MTESSVRTNDASRIPGAAHRSATATTRTTGMLQTTGDMMRQHGLRVIAVAVVLIPICSSPVSVSLGMFSRSERKKFLDGICAFNNYCFFKSVHVCLRE